MTLKPKVCTPKDKVAVAINLMWDHDCGAVPVVNDLESKELIGIVTDRDIAMHLVRHASAHPAQVEVADCMSANVIACQLEDALESAIQLMSEHRVRRLPVIDPNGSCVGIISQADLLSRAAADMEDIIALLQQVSIPHREIQAASAAVAKEETPPEKEPETPAAPEETKPDTEKPSAATEKTVSAADRGGEEKNKKK
jgi:CBS-domain-containing membrane protein